MNTISRHRLTAALTVFTLAAGIQLLSASPVHAQVPPPPDYQLTWTTCTNVEDLPDEDSVAGTFTYTVPTTGEVFEVALLMVSTPARSYLSADYYNSAGALVATLEIVDDASNYRLTEHSRRLSQAASMSFVDVLRTDDFQAHVLDGCLALKCKPWVKKFIKGLCIAAAGICCAVSGPACPACATAGAACAGAVDIICG